MKHTLLIFSQAMELGGVERSLLGLLDSIDYDHYDVDLFLMRHSGELMPYLNPKANLLPEIPQYASLAVPMVSLLKSGQIGVLYGRLRGKLAAKRFDKRHPGGRPSVTALTYSHKYTLSAMPQISDKTYDLAISFLTPHYFARERVKAKNMRRGFIRIILPCRLIGRRSLPCGADTTRFAACRSRRPGVFGRCFRSFQTRFRPSKISCRKN